MTARLMTRVATFSPSAARMAEATCAITRRRPGRDPEQLAQLPRDHDHCHPGQVSAQHRSAEQLGDETEAQKSRYQRQCTHDEGAHCGHGGVLGRIADRQGRKCGSREDGGRGLGADAQ